MALINLQFLGGEDIGAALIKWFGDGPVSHVDTLLDNGMLLGARHDEVGGAPSGVQIRKPGYAKIDRLVRIAIPVTDEQKRIYLEFIHAQVGKPYDTLDIAGFVFGRDWRNPDAWICSEVPPAGLERCGKLPKLFVPDNKITPPCLATIATAIGGEIVLDQDHWPV